MPTKLPTKFLVCRLFNLPSNCDQMDIKTNAELYKCTWGHWKYYENMKCILLINGKGVCFHVSFTSQPTKTSKHQWCANCDDKGYIMQPTCTEIRFNLNYHVLSNSINRVTICVEINYSGKILPTISDEQCETLNSEILLSFFFWLKRSKSGKYI